MQYLLPLHVRFRQSVAIVLMLALANMSSSCHFYKVQTEKEPEAATAVSLVQQPGKYYIIHSGDEAWHLSHITVSDEEQTLSGTLEALPAIHESYLTGEDRQPGGPPSFKSKHHRYRPVRSTPEYEVHIYTNEAIRTGSEQATVSFNSVKRIDVYDKAVGHTTASYVFGALGIAAGVFVVIVIIALLTKSSCPFAYTQNENGNWDFTGELYGGAIYAPLERDDYMPLPLVKSSANTASIKISNELLERQYTDLARITSVLHPAGTAVLLDSKGTPQIITLPQPPVAASSSNGDYTAAFLTRDDRSFLFDAGDSGDAGVSSTTLSFQKPAGATTGKLVLKAKNSYWLDYAFGKFTECFGTYYNTFAASQKGVPGAELKAWSQAQHIPLTVSVQTPEGWREAGAIETMGPLASRDLVVPVDLAGIAGDAVHIRLQCGYMFWEVDYAAMDFTPNAPLKVQETAPATATDEQGKSVTSALGATDGDYLVQPSVGNKVIAQYKLPQPGRGEARTCFLHSRGYYEYIRHFKNIPDVPQLLSFKKDGAFTRFSKARYNELANRRSLYNTAFNNR